MCADCADAIKPLPQACYRCGTLSQTGICPKCKIATRLSGVYPACLYNGTVAKLIRELKYEHNRSAAVVIAELMNRRLPDFGECVITNVPTASSRVRQRSFDHSRLLAKKFAELRNLKYIDVLHRSGNKRQVGAPKLQRLTQLNGAFWVGSNSAFKDRYVLVLDDVVTTGGTVDEVARTLKAAGAKKVIAMSFAHKKLG